MVLLNAVALAFLLLALAAYPIESFSPCSLQPFTRTARGRAPIQNTKLGYKSNVRNNDVINTESKFLKERLLTKDDNKSSNDDENAAVALGSTSCALGPHPIAILDGQHLCQDRRFSSATIYAPSNDQQLLPSVVMIGGWGCGESVLGSWGPFLASHGIVAMTIGAPNPFADMPQDRCQSLIDAMEALQTEHRRRGSFLEGRLDSTKRAVMGMSLGGAGAQLAALKDPSLSCVVALVPHDGTGPPLYLPNPPSFPNELTAKVPTLLICGEQDEIADPQKHAWPMYHKCSAEKVIFEVAGGDHGITHGPAGWSSKEDTFLQGFSRTCSVVYTLLNWYAFGKAVPFESMTREGHARVSSPNGEIGGVTLAWLKWCLLQDEASRNQLLNEPKIASGYATSGVEKNVPVKLS